MAILHKVGDIEVTQDLRFQRREWRVQRIAWVVMLLILALALAGGFGKGPLARTQVEAADGSFRLDYERIVRHSASTHFRFKLNRTAHDTVGIWFDAPYIHAVRIEQVLPEPIHTRTRDGIVTYYFLAEPGAEISFQIEPDRLWRRASRVGVERGAAVLIKQFVLP